MANDKVGVANIALQKVGANSIRAFDQNSDEAKAISAVYDDVRDEVLCEHPWSFALKRAMLTVSADVPAFTNDGVSTVYNKPNDCLKVFFVNIAGALVHVEGNRILSNVAGLGIKYVFRNDNPSQYFSMFTMALATRLAAEICFNLTDSKGKAKDIFEEYEKIRLPRATGSDSQQGTPHPAQQNEWEIAMFSFGGVVANPGQQTWHPIW